MEEKNIELIGGIRDGETITILYPCATIKFHKNKSVKPLSPSDLSTDLPIEVKYYEYFYSDRRTKEGRRIFFSEDLNL